jgi:hypothetical protein
MIPKEYCANEIALLFRIESQSITEEKFIQSKSGLIVPGPSLLCIIRRLQTSSIL